MDNALLLQTCTIRGMTAGPVGPFLPGYVSFLQQHRYSPNTIQCSLHAACAFGRWLERRKISLDQLSEKVLTQYRDPFRRKKKKPLLPAEVTGLPKLLTWMREQQLIPPDVRSNPTEQESWLGRFDDHLVAVHGISESTRSKYIACAARFFSDVFENSTPDWSVVTADRIRQFVETDIRHHHAEQTVCALRATLRFLPRQ